MGLDMYAMITREPIHEAVDFKVRDAAELHYWRKHPNLHGWMEALYHAKGGGHEAFNCVLVALSPEDFDRLEEAILLGSLPHTEGCFFGESDGSELEDDLDFVGKARAAQAAGYTVFYDSWW